MAVKNTLCLKTTYGQDPLQDSQSDKILVPHERRHRNEEAAQDRSEISQAEDQFGAVLGPQDPPRDLGDPVEPEEGAQDARLFLLVPGEGDPRGVTLEYFVRGVESIRSSSLQIGVVLRDQTLASECEVVARPGFHHWYNGDVQVGPQHVVNSEAEEDQVPEHISRRATLPRPWRNVKQNDLQNLDSPLPPTFPIFYAEKDQAIEHKNKYKM